MTPWICSQLGAREHYAIPRALHQSSLLRMLFTDVWARGVWQGARFLGGPGQALAGRWHPRLASAEVRDFSTTFLPQILRVRRERRREGTNLWNLFLHQFRELGDSVRNCLPAEEFTFFSYTGTFLEPAQFLRETGHQLVLGQYDPAGIEEEIVEREMELWPGWERFPVRIPEEFRERRAREWELADRIIVNSPWSRQALLKQNVTAEKISVIPLVYESPSSAVAAIRPVSSRLRVLYLGQVILRKGIQYLLEAARELQEAPVDILVAGPLWITDEAIASAPENVTFLGPVSRGTVTSVYEQADVFILPTLSDGFAITQLEAMAHGLPVIATPNCGEVVQNRENGIVVPPGDASALSQAILDVQRDRAFLAHLKENARETSSQFGINRLSEALLQLSTS